MVKLPAHGYRVDAHTVLRAAPRRGRGIRSLPDPGPLPPVFAVIGICLHPLWIFAPFPLFRNRLSSVNPSVVVAATVFTVVAVVTLLNFSGGEVRYVPPEETAGWAWEIARTALRDLGLARSSLPASPPSRGREGGASQVVSRPRLE